MKPPTRPLFVIKITCELHGIIETPPGFLNVLKSPNSGTFYRLTRGRNHPVDGENPDLTTMNQIKMPTVPTKVEDFIVFHVMSVNRMTSVRCIAVGADMGGFAGWCF